MRISSFLLLLAGCPGGSAGNTLIYAFDDAPVGLTDPALCAPDIGLDIALGFSDAVAFSIATGGNEAFLATCTLATDGTVTSCGLMAPETELILDGDTISGEATGRVDFTEEACTGADVTVSYTMTVDGDALTGTANAVWDIDDSFDCEQLESAVIAQTGRGINGCRVTYPFTALRHAECSNTLTRCDY